MKISIYFNDGRGEPLHRCNCNIETNHPVLIESYDHKEITQDELGYLLFKGLRPDNPHWDNAYTGWIEMTLNAKECKELMGHLQRLLDSYEGPILQKKTKFPGIVRKGGYNPEPSSERPPEPQPEPPVLHEKGSKERRMK